MPIYINMFQHVLPGFVLGEQNVLPLFPGARRRSRYNRVMKPIAHIHSDLPQKFGIPRNSFLAPHLQASVIFEPEFALNSAVEGLDEFSHLCMQLIIQIIKCYKLQIASFRRLVSRSLAELRF